MCRSRKRREEEEEEEEEAAASVGDLLHHLHCSNFSRNQINTKYQESFCSISFLGAYNDSVHSAEHYY
jgi:hypothetical protein